MNLDDSIREQIVAIGRKYSEVRKISLFGSRARGDNLPRSDIDIAVYTKHYSFLDWHLFCEDVDNIDTLYKIDIIHVRRDLKQKMADNIKRDEVCIVNKLRDKLEDFVKATARMQESIAEYNQTKSTSVRDGAIQRFEFSVELAWKTAREYLLDQGYTELNSPKKVMQKSFEYGLISDSESWVKLLNDRNITSHVYKEELANEIYDRIVNTHTQLLCNLILRIKD